MVPRKNNRSCTLKIKNLLDNRLHIYFQIVAEKSFSFSRQSVTITASGEQFVKISSSFQIAVVLLSTFHNTTSLVGPDAMPGTFNPGNSPVFDLDYGRCNQIVLLWQVSPFSFLFFLLQELFSQLQPFQKIRHVSMLIRLKSQVSIASLLTVVSLFLTAVIDRKMVQTICISVFVPLAAIVILLAAGFLLWKRHAR